MLKGPKRSFVVVVVLGVESKAKNISNGTKIVQANKKCAREKKMFKGTKKVQGNKKCAREQKMFCGTFWY